MSHIVPFNPCLWNIRVRPGNLERIASNLSSQLPRKWGFIFARAGGSQTPRRNGDGISPRLGRQPRLFLLRALMRQSHSSVSIPVVLTGAAHMALNVLPNPSNPGFTQV